MLKHISHCVLSLICSIRLVLKFAEVTYSHLTDSSWLSAFSRHSSVALPTTYKRIRGSVMAVSSHLLFYSLLISVPFLPFLLCLILQMRKLGWTKENSLITFLWLCPLKIRMQCVAFVPAHV